MKLSWVISGVGEVICTLRSDSLVEVIWRTALPLCEPRLSMITMSPGLSVGTRTFSTMPAFVRRSAFKWMTSLFSNPREDARLIFIQIVSFQEFGPEILWWSGDVWPALWCKVHEIPIRPHRIDMIGRQFTCPEMINLSILLPEYMHHGQLHVIGVSLALVIGLKGRVRSGDQRNLRPSASFGPRIDLIG